MLYAKYMKMLLKKTMQYRASTIISTFVQMVLCFGEIVSLILLFMQFRSIGEWNFYHICLMYGIVMVSFPAAECFCRGFDMFPKLVRNGELDRFFVRPRSIFFQIFSADISLSKFGRIISGIIMTIIGIINIGIAWTFIKVLVVIAMFVCAFVVTFALFLINAGLCVFTIEPLEFFNIFTNGGRDICQYPINIYGKWFARFFTFILPLSCFNYLPLLYLVNNASFWIYGMAPIYGMIFFVPCYFFFKWSLTKYKGTGT